MKKVIQFAVQLQFVQEDGKAAVILVIAPQGQVIGVCEDFDEVPALLQDFHNKVTEHSVQ